MSDNLLWTVLEAPKESLPEVVPLNFRIPELGYKDKKWKYKKRNNYNTKEMTVWRN